jgi:peroxiredoxin/predicted 2-oxoglutarate/Fe(II)-dependent dioxygenase YbiX
MTISLKPIGGAAAEDALRELPTTRLLPGDPAPCFVARCSSRPVFHFDTVAGRYVALCFFGSAADPATRAMLAEIFRHRRLFDDEHASFFGVSADPADERRMPSRGMLPGFRMFWDGDATIAERYGLVRGRGDRAGRRFARATVVLDPRLRVLAVLPVDDAATHAARLVAFVAGLPPLAGDAASSAAPVLVVPRVFEPEFCRALIEGHERGGAFDSGFMRSDDTGRTVMVVDHRHKRRRDHLIEDARTRRAIDHRLARRLLPEMRKAFQFDATRIERHLVARYDAGAGHFRPHRDDTTKGTAHRRFAVTINLNAESYEGGDLRFPEYGPRASYRPPSGGAVIFSCSLLHEALPVTRGVRYAFLPFLYDDAAAELRARNLEHLADPTLRDAVRASIADSAALRRPSSTQY